MSTDRSIVDAKLTCSKSDGGSSVCDTDPQNKLEVSITKLASFFFFFLPI